MEKSNKEDNVIYIGKKPIKNYNFVINKKLSQNKEVIIATRGRLTEKAINIASFLEHIGKVKIREVKISGNKITSEDKERFIPEIHITLIKK